MYVSGMGKFGAKKNTGVSGVNLFGGFKFYKSDFGLAPSMLLAIKDSSISAI